LLDVPALAQHREGISFIHSLFLFFLFPFAILTLGVIMSSTIQAIYENGVLKPLQKLDIPERQTVEIIIVADDLSSSLIAEVAEHAGSYTFLSHVGEDVYTIEDGERVD